MTARKAGRPQKNLDVRQLLIEHARDLFVVQPYDKVSTRLIADRAGVNIAMIRYYFGSKAGLFEAMLRETLRPMQLQMQRLVEESSHENFLDLMRTYYKEMVKVPKFPRLIAQVMNMPPSEVQRELLEKVFLDVTKPAQDVIFEKLVAQGVLRKDMDPKLCRVSYISLMVFPFIAPPPLFAIHGIEINEEFLNRLIEHNIKLMTEGFINTPSPFSVQDQR
ncbi:Transcriptional regulator [Vibrio crassostreae]|uniref:TetR/AcrR family transcriptional regulator n=1 Tax=Vibrio crassostreae TaxID=246167 RepID=UPI0005DF07DC|nr:TetR/AcrR family transcriptional regulator [Vibrio crassostreae]TCT58244.1 transcriptional regulator /TetR family transcriptional regulator [Vibrio crassostreae]TCT79035.1 transcriptional regulator /TetR family transcriptional regulator [Vibrio crassostreae]TCU04179.1 transcriptional regulator /TetR family transcriptional regulator [Vibrio crassostreae]TDW06546.1 transcriptional regulator /TetR family transcriptional regulator [Vibrio crassostreae]CAK1766845.1 Transcriptional regulator [Vib